MKLLAVWVRLASDWGRFPLPQHPLTLTQIRRNHSRTTYICRHNTFCVEGMSTKLAKCSEIIISTFILFHLPGGLKRCAF